MTSIHVGPPLPISSPDDFSRDVAKETGRFFTQGIAEDTAAYRHGVFNLCQYLSQSRLVFEDEMRLLRYCLVTSVVASCFPISRS